MIVTRPQKKESDLLIGFEYEKLIITCLGGNIIKVIEPQEPWTHDKLEMVNYNKYADFGWDAYLGGQWIGSSEV